MNIQLQVPTQQDDYQCGIIVLRMIEGITRFAQECNFDLDKCLRMSASDIGFPDLLKDLPTHRQRIGRLLGSIFESACRTSSTSSADEVSIICEQFPFFLFKYYF